MKSLYIHIPFCRTICSYCDFCKMLYNSNIVNLYLKALRQEIQKKYKNETIKTLYIGGGTPSTLTIEQLKELFSIISIIKKDKDIEFTIECNVESLSLEKIKLFKEYGVNRISLGVETFNKKHQQTLNRYHTYNDIVEIIKNINNNDIHNINIDLIYALPNQTLQELEKDLELALSLNITHISTYSLIIEEHTLLYINKVDNIDQDLDRNMYELIKTKLKDFVHYEISNFSLPGYESKHNLTYWDNEHYYGFGLGASGYIDNTRYDNTKNIDKYLNGNYLSFNNPLNRIGIIENEFILGLRKTKGINKEIFYKKYNIDINSIKIVDKLIKQNKLIDDGKNIFINELYIYVSNSILVDFLGEEYE